MGNKQYINLERRGQAKAPYATGKPAEKPTDAPRKNPTGSAWWFDWPLEWDIDKDDEIEWPF